MRSQTTKHNRTQQLSAERVVCGLLAVWMLVCQFPVPVLHSHDVAFSGHHSPVLIEHVLLHHSLQETGKAGDVHWHWLMPWELFGDSVTDCDKGSEARSFVAQRLASKCLGFAASGGGNAIDVACVDGLGRGSFSDGQAQLLSDHCRCAGSKFDILRSYSDLGSQEEAVFSQVVASAHDLHGCQSTFYDCQRLSRETGVWLL